VRLGVDRAVAAGGFVFIGTSCARKLFLPFTLAVGFLIPEKPRAHPKRSRRRAAVASDAAPRRSASCPDTGGSSGGFRQFRLLAGAASLSFGASGSTGRNRSVGAALALCLVAAFAGAARRLGRGSLACVVPPPCCIAAFLTSPQMSQSAQNDPEEQRGDESPSRRRSQNSKGEGKADTAPPPCAKTGGLHCSFLRQMQFISVPRPAHSR